MASSQAQQPSADGRSRSASPPEPGPPGGPTTHRPHKAQGIFDVLVGTAPDQASFELHTSIFRDRSRYFRRHLNARTDPALRNTTPAVFGAYLTIAYGRSVTDAVETLANAPGDAYSRQLIDTYNLARSLDDHTVCNKIMDWMISQLHTHDDNPSTEDVVHIYSTQPPSTHPLRRLIYIWFVQGIDKEGDDVNWEAFPQQMLADCMKFYTMLKHKYREDDRKLARVLRMGPWRWSRCWPFHVHNADHPACKTREEMLEEMRTRRGI